MKMFMLIASGLLAATAAGQTTGVKPGPAKSPARATATQPSAPSLTPTGLRTEGLNFGDDLTRLYVGEFGHVEFAREGTEFSVLVSTYMTTYSRKCADALPKDKVEIMTRECSQEAWTVNGYGMEIPGSRHCVSYRTVGTGRYADPQVYALYKQVDSATARTMVGDMFNAMKQGGDPAGGMRRMTDIATYMRDDMAKLVQENGCASPSLMRLQANMIRFGQGKDPIVMPGGAAALADKSPSAGGLFKEQNYQRLLDDLITEESKAWMMNRYRSGSVRTGAITRDSQGRPSEIAASYSFMAMQKLFVGKLRVTFLDGVPKCLYFSDNPTLCRALSPRIVSAYRKHKYAEEAGAGQQTARQPDATGAEQTRAAAPADPGGSAAQPLPAVSMERSVPATPPEREPTVTQSREAMQQAREAADRERMAAAKKRQCTALRANIDRTRQTLAGVPPQYAERRAAQVSRMELSYRQQCSR